MSKVQFQNRKIFIDGQAVQIISGAIHYFRVHQDLWRDRLEKLAMCGFNCVETYMCWNLHEPQEGVWDFDGMMDIVRFIKTAQELGLYVIVRPGPYICAEWDNGGFPHWLMVKEGIKFRRMNKVFLDHVQKYFDKVMPMLLPLQYDNGGPVIMMQIENEYGSYNRDLEYIAACKKIMESFGVTVPLFTADGAGDSYLTNGMLPGTPAMLTGGSHAIDGFELLKDRRPEDVPFFMEFWLGWFEHWRNDPKHSRSAESVAAELDDIIRYGGNVNMYMFHGGTNFGFTAGANKTTTWEDYTPDVTSYDYDAPLNEYGDPTDKYFAMQQVIKKYFPERAVAVPEPVKRKAYGKIDFRECAPLFSNLENIGKKYESQSPLKFEEMKQGFGFAHYRTTVAGPQTAHMWFPAINDCADIFVNGKRAATFDRNVKDNKVFLEVPPEGVTVDILVENFGRVNYGHLTGIDFKGLVEGVCVGNAYCTGWENWSLPMDDLSALKYGAMPRIRKMPAFYRTEFEVSEKADTFVRFPGVRGVIWVNGFNLGRYWSVGSGNTLYLPAPVLKEGKNEIVVFECEELKYPYVELVSEQEL